MAEITGPFRFKGSLGNFRVYWNKAAKKWVVATKGGGRRESILYSPVFARTRENMSEFKACGKFCKLIRIGLFHLDHLNWGYYMSWIVQLSKVIQLKDVDSKRGQRNIEPSKCKSLLTDINFNEEHPFKQVVIRHPEVISDAERNTITVKLPKFYPWYELRWKEDYSNYRFLLTIAQLSDYNCVEEDGGYGPVHYGIENKSITVNSDWMMHDTNAVDISLTASFKEDAIPPSDATVLVALGIEFASSVSGNSYSAAKGDGTMALVACL